MLTSDGILRSTNFLRNSCLKQPVQLSTRALVYQNLVWHVCLFRSWINSNRPNSNLNCTLSSMVVHVCKSQCSGGWPWRITTVQGQFERHIYWVQSQLQTNIIARSYLREKRKEQKEFLPNFFYYRHINNTSILLYRKHRQAQLTVLQSKQPSKACPSCFMNVFGLNHTC